MSDEGDFEAFHWKANEQVSSALVGALKDMDWDVFAKPMYEHFMAECRRLAAKGGGVQVMPWTLGPDGEPGELKITAYVTLGEDEALEVRDIPLSNIMFDELGDDPEYYIEAAKRSIAIAEERLIQWKLDNPRRVRP